MVRKRIGILGGGQLGRMLAQAAIDWNLDIWILDKSDAYPAAQINVHFVEGDINSYDDVLNFGRQCDLITIEIEHVNTAALRQIQAEGKPVFPDANILDTIKDKGLQKQFYQKHQIPTAPFAVYEDVEAIKAMISAQKITTEGYLKKAYVQKSRTAGYDGKGVKVIRHINDLNDLIPRPSMVEELVDIDKEIAVIIARNPTGQIVSYPPVEMVFHPTANLVEYIQCPTSLTPSQNKAAVSLAEKVALAYDFYGILAVELFLDTAGKWSVNEVAPRTHNSGHHTIEACMTSQFQQQLRAILNLPLGDTSLRQPAAMINLLGHPDFSGSVKVEGMEEALALPGVFIHLYGKTTTKPFRKMGHATILGDDIDTIRRTAKRTQQLIKIIAQ